MNTRQWTTAVKLWERAYPDYPEQYSPDVHKLRKWFDQHKNKGGEFWADWPEGLSLRVYLSSFYDSKKPLCPVVNLAKYRKTKRAV